MIRGVDASRHQGVPNWTQVANAGFGFAFLKATDGIRYSYVNWFLQNAPAVQATGMILGAYHFLLDQHPGQDQARYFVQQVERLYPGFRGVVPIVDIEREADGSTPGVGVLRDFVNAFHELVPNRPILIYTGRWYWVGVLKNPHGADLGPLWHSEYDGISPINEDVANGPEGLPYGGWTSCVVWQHTSSGVVPGIGGSVDLNIFHGDREALLALAGLTAPTPPEEEDDMPAVDIAVDGRDGAHYQVLNYETATWLSTPDHIFICTAYWDSRGVKGLTPINWDNRDIDQVCQNPGSRPAPSWVDPRQQDDQ